MMELPARVDGTRNTVRKKPHHLGRLAKLCRVSQTRRGRPERVGEIREKNRFETMRAAIQIYWVATYFAG